MHDDRWSGRYCLLPSRATRTRQGLSSRIQIAKPPAAAANSFTLLSS